MAPTMRRAASRGNCVSASSVMTYFTCRRIAGVADDAREAAVRRGRGAARSGRPASRACARSPSRRVPRDSSAAGGGRGRTPRGRYFVVQLADPLLGEAHERLVLRQRLLGTRRPGRSGGRSATWSSRLPRKRTSSASTSCSTSCALVISVGTTTRVREAGGDALRQVHLRQGARRRQPRHQRVHEGDGHLAGAQQQEDRRAARGASRRAFAVAPSRSAPPSGSSVRAAIAPEIERQRVAEARAPHGLGDRRSARAPPVRAARAPCRRGRSRRAPPWRRGRRSRRPPAASPIASRATSPSVRPLRLAVVSTTWRYWSRVAKSIAA